MIKELLIKQTLEEEHSLKGNRRNLSCVTGKFDQQRCLIYEPYFKRSSLKYVARSWEGVFFYWYPCQQYQGTGKVSKNGRKTSSRKTEYRFYLISSAATLEFITIKMMRKIRGVGALRFQPSEGIFHGCRCMGWRTSTCSFKPEKYVYQEKIWKRRIGQI